MKNTIKSLVLIWLTTLAVPVFADDLFATSDGMEKMYISNETSEKSNHKKSKNTSVKEYHYIYVPYEYEIKDKEDVVFEEVKSDDLNQSEIEDEVEKEDNLPRLKRVYIGVYGGYFYTKDDMLLSDVKKCSGAYKSDFFCIDEVSNPVNLEYKDEYFLSASFGINSANMLRLELSYFTLGKQIDLEGLNQVNGLTQKYLGNIDLKGGSFNLYIDLVGDRRQPYLMFVPYVMAGIGASEIDFGDIKFTDTSLNNYTIGGKVQRNRTVIYGAGFTAGLNNYISLDIGCRFYNFGKVKTDTGMSNGSDVQLETELKAYIATVGLKFQI